MLEHKKFPKFERKKDLLEKKELGEEYWCTLAKDIFLESNELGYGNAAYVYDSSIETNLCIKRIRQEEIKKYPYMNTLEEESQFLVDVASLVEEGDDIIVPEPALFIHSEKIETITQKNLRGELVTFPKRIREDVLAMDRINGSSFEDILNPKEEKFRKELPENFDYKIFFEKLKKFIIKMNEKGIYHQDLHAGNIMIDFETGNPVIIDFGLAKKRFSSEEDVYKEDLGPTGVTRFVDDLTRLGEVIDDFESVYLQK